MPTLNPVCIVQSGYLWKSPPLKKQHMARWKYRWFVLYDSFNDGGRELELIYFDNENEQKKSGKFIGTINLMEVKVLAISKKPKNGYPFVLRIVSEDRTWFLCTKSFEDFNEWVAALKERTDRFVTENKIHERHHRPLRTRSSSMSTIESSTGSWSTASRGRLNTTDIHACLEDPKLFPGRQDPHFEGNGASGASNHEGGNLKRSQTLTVGKQRRPTFFGKFFGTLPSKNKKPNLYGIEEGTDERTQIENQNQLQNPNRTFAPSPTISQPQQPNETTYDPLDRHFQGPTLKSNTYQRDRAFSSSYGMGSAASTPSSAYSTDKSDTEAPNGSMVDYHDTFKLRYIQDQTRQRADNVSRSSSDADWSPRHAITKKPLSMIREARFGDNDNRFETDSDTSSRYHEDMEFNPTRRLSTDVPSTNGSAFCQDNSQNSQRVLHQASIESSSISHSAEQQNLLGENTEGCTISRSSMRSYRRRRSCEESQITRPLDEEHPVFNLFVSFSMQDLTSLDGYAGDAEVESVNGTYPD